MILRQRAPSWEGGAGYRSDFDCPGEDTRVWNENSGMDVKYYSSVSRALLFAAACLLFAAPGSSAQPDQYYVPKRPPVTLRFVAVDPAREPIDERWLLDGITTALQAQSRWPLSSTGETTRELAGLRTRLDPGHSQIIFEYVHVARNRNGDEWGESLTIPVSYLIEKTHDISIIRLYPPLVADFARRRTPGVFFLPVPKLRSVAELFDDFFAIMDAAPSVVLRHAFLLHGEEEVESSPQTCVGNFDRALGRYAYSKDEKRLFDPAHDDVFLYRTVQDSVALKVTALRSEHGSRVFYEAWMPFELHADGTMQGYDLPLALQSEVRRVLDDQPARRPERGLASFHDPGKARN